MKKIVSGFFVCFISILSFAQTKDNESVKPKGDAISVLKKINSAWKIMVNHNSSGK